MVIALIAHDSKKELMVQFCNAYCVILSKNKLCATETTGRLVAAATGLRVTRFLSGRQGGGQQIASRITYGEIDALLFFRDPFSPLKTEVNDVEMLRLCDMHNVPFATNIAAAQILIRGIERGDLDWRQIINNQ